MPSIDVFFEFASPYSYLAAQELPAGGTPWPAAAMAAD
jgi:2-hydroxychromene-2-carboxylate isomerase